MHTETVTIYSYSELSEEAKTTAYKAWEPDYAFEADNRRTLDAFCDAFTTPTVMNISGRATRRLRGRNLRSTSATASPSSIRPGFIWTKRSSARRNNRQTERTSATWLTSV